MWPRDDEFDGAGSAEAGPGGLRPAGAGGPQALDWNETVMKVGSGPEGFDVLGDGRTIWVANAQDGTVSIVDFAGRRVTETLALNVRGANRLKFTVDGRRR